MEAFPTVEALAAAGEEEVNARWAGLGFYRRARFLHEGSQQVVADFGGGVPTTVDELMGLASRASGGTRRARSRRSAAGWPLRSLTAMCSASPRGCTRWRPAPRSRPTAPTASSLGRWRDSSSRRAAARGRASSTRPSWSSARPSVHRAARAPTRATRSLPTTAPCSSGATRTAHTARARCCRCSTATLPTPTPTPTLGAAAVAVAAAVLTVAAAAPAAPAAPAAAKPAATKPGAAACTLARSVGTARRRSWRGCATSGSLEGLPTRQRPRRTCTGCCRCRRPRRLVARRGSCCSRSISTPRLLARPRGSRRRGRAIAAGGC